MELPGQETKTHWLRPDATRELCAAVLAGAGLPHDDAVLVAGILVRTSLRGVDSHGVVRLAQYAENLLSGRLNARAQMRWVKEFGVVGVFDADNGLGHIAATRGMQQAVELAERHGVGCVSVRNSSHFGPAAEYPYLAASRGCIGLAWTNAQAVMAPWGGKQARVSNNPLAIGVPTRGEPLVLDIAMSIAAGGKIRLAHLAGEAIPAGWALDKHGDPTTVPGEATEGLLLPIGQHKGYGLAFMGDVLSGVLSGSKFGVDVGSLGVAALGMRVSAGASEGPGIGHFLLALSPAAFGSPEDFLNRLERLVDQIHDCATLDSVDRIFVPGQLENETVVQRKSTGVPVSAAVLQAITEAAARVGVTLPSELEV